MTKQYQPANWISESTIHALALSDKERVRKVKEDKALQARINQNVKILK
jgi:hypothetical protein